MGGGGILASDSISGQDIGILFCFGVLVVFVFGILILYLTHTKNYAKADIKVFGSHNYEYESRYLHISDVVQICTSFLHFSRETNPQKYVDSEWKNDDQCAR